jgi:hypothetical protein
MSEQQGQAAGTAQAITPTSEFHTPWRNHPGAPCLILDESGAVVINVFGAVMLRSVPEAEHASLARRIVACVNFCAAFNTDLLEFLANGNFEVNISRINLRPGEHAVTLSAQESVDCALHGKGSPAPVDFAGARAQFHRDLRNGDASAEGALPGGAI